jgi:YVTN family beta-propeller protein
MLDTNGTTSIFNRGWIFQAIMAVLFVGLNFLNPVTAKSAQSKHSEGSHAKASSNHRVVKEGISIELSTRPLASHQEKSQKLVEGQDAKIRFTLKDSNTNENLGGLYPAAWMDLKNPTREELSCKEKIGSFLRSQVGFRPEVDLNSWFILALNNQGSISVIDPLADSGASGMLHDLITLDDRAETWVLGPKSDWLYVTLPKSGKVAVIDTDTWKVKTQIETGKGSRQITFQPDHRYLWVGLDDAINGNEKTGGVAVIDPKTLKVLKRIETGKGHHEFAFSKDSQYAYVTNEKSGTVSVIDTWKLEINKDIKAGKLPVALAYSKLADAIYIADSKEGTIHVIDPAKNEVVRRMNLDPGLNGIQFSPDGRWGFVSNMKSKEILIFDSSRNQKAHSFNVGEGPNQVVFSGSYAYVHSVGSSQLSAIEMKSLEKRGSIPIIQIPMGKNPSKEMSDSIKANMIAVTPEESSVVVANPVDENIFYYMEGMNAPMGSFGNFRRRPKAIMTVDKGLKETSPGSYEAFMNLSKPGTYDVAFLLDNPKVTHCFSITVEDDPKIRSAKRGKLQIKMLSPGREVAVGQPFELRVRLQDSVTGKPRKGVKDLLGNASIASGIWQDKVLAQPVKDGEYILKFMLPRPGPYWVTFESRSLNLPVHKGRPLFIQAKTLKAKNHSTDKADTKPSETK